jgi:hypothetical protein
MIALFCLFLALFASPFKSKSRLEAENAALRHQLIILRRKVRGRVRLTNSDRLFFIEVYGQAMRTALPGMAAPSCVTMRRTSPPWTCSLPRPLASTRSMSSSWAERGADGSIMGSITSCTGGPRGQREGGDEGAAAMLRRWDCGITAAVGTALLRRCGSRFPLKGKCDVAANSAPQLPATVAAIVRRHKMRRCRKRTIISSCRSDTDV